MPCAFARPASYLSAVNNFESLRTKCRAHSHDQLPIIGSADGIIHTHGNAVRIRTTNFLSLLSVKTRLTHGTMPCAFARPTSYHAGLPTVICASLASIRRKYGRR